jgi:hypothetical protein
MRKSLGNRIADLEAQGEAGMSKAEMELAADEFRVRIENLAARYTDADRGLSLADRLKMSPAQDYAWRMRFEGPPDLLDVMEEHGRARKMPLTPVEMVLADMSAKDLAL